MSKVVFRDFLGDESVFGPCWSKCSGSRGHLRWPPFRAPAVQTLDYLPILLGGAKELGIVYINIIRGAKEPRNVQNHRGATVHTKNSYVQFMAGGVGGCTWVPKVGKMIAQHP